MTEELPTVLIIDDDKFFLEFYRAELAQYKYQIEFARDGEEGLAKAKEVKPEIILLDVILPKMDGFEVLAALKKDQELADIPVIIVTSLGTEEDMQRLLKLGALKSFNKIKNLPSEVAEEIGVVLKARGEKVPTVELKREITKLDQSQVEKVFRESLRDLNDSLEKLFGRKPALEDMQVALMPYGTLREHLDELAHQAGTLMVFGEVEAVTKGMAILSMKRDDTLTLIKLIEQATVGKDMGLALDDQVVEEFFNMVVNAFLNKLAESVKSTLLLQTPEVMSAREVSTRLESLDIPSEQVVVSFDQAYIMRELNLSFELFVVFGKKLWEKEDE